MVDHARGVRRLGFQVVPDHVHDHQQLLVGGLLFGEPHDLQIALDADQDGAAVLRGERRDGHEHLLAGLARLRDLPLSLQVLPHTGGQENVQLGAGMLSATGES